MCPGRQPPNANRPIQFAILHDTLIGLRIRGLEDRDASALLVRPHADNSAVVLTSHAVQPVAEFNPRWRTRLSFDSQRLRLSAVLALAFRLPNNLLKVVRITNDEMRTVSQHSRKPFVGGSLPIV